MSGTVSKTRVPVPLIDYDSRLEEDFYPYYTRLGFPPLYFYSSESRTTSIEQANPSIKTWAGVHVDDWGEESISVQVSGIVAPFRTSIGDLTDDMRQAYYGHKGIQASHFDPSLNSPLSSFYTGFNEKYAGYNVTKTFGFKYFSHFLNFWRSNATLFSKNNIPVVQGTVLLYTEFSAVDYDKTALKPSEWQSQQRDEYQFLTGQQHAVPGEIFMGKIQSFSWEEAGPYMWKISFTLNAFQQYMSIAASDANIENPVFPTRSTSPNPTTISSYSPLTTPWTMDVDDTQPAYGGS